MGASRLDVLWGSYVSKIQPAVKIMMSVSKHSIVQPRASNYDTKVKRKLEIYLPIPIELPLLGLVKLTDSVSAS